MSRAYAMIFVAVFWLAAISVPSAGAQQVIPGAAWVSPGAPPPGANVPCPIGYGNGEVQVWVARNPTPIILVHGTLGDMASSWSMISPALVAAGYCVFAFELDNRGTVSLATSADKLSDFIDQVLDATGAGQVSIIGHSQGGMLPRASGGPFDDVIGLAPANDGFNEPGTVFLANLGANHANCVACAELQQGSAFLAGLPATAGGDDTVLAVWRDEVLGTASPFLPGATNVTLSDKCPEDRTEHVGILYDPIALQWILNALEENGPADPAFDPVC